MLVKVRDIIAIKKADGDQVTLLFSPFKLRFGFLV